MRTQSKSEVEDETRRKRRAKQDARPMQVAKAKAKVASAKAKVASAKAKVKDKQQRDSVFATFDPIKPRDPVFNFFDELPASKKPSNMCQIPNFHDMKTAT